MLNDEMIQEYIMTRNLSKQTYNILSSVLNHYSTFQEMSLEDLIEEADNEEEEKIRWKKRKLKKRLINYMNYCADTMMFNSAKSYVNLVKSFYYHHEIEIHKLPPFNSKNLELEDPITYADLPDKDIIRLAYEQSNSLMKALLLFLSSSGMSKVDALNLKVDDFITATRDYHSSGEIHDVIKELNEYEGDIIPVWRHRRQKTNKYFITFNTGEATLEILNYLSVRDSKKSLSGGDKLFKINKHYYTLKFEELNNRLNLGKVGTYNRLRGHMLRKFHASNLEKHGMDRYKINVLQGKSNNAVDDVYFFEDEEKLLEEYVKAMEGLLIFTEVKEIDRYSDEYKAIVKENKMLQEQSKKVEKIEEKVKEILEWYKY